MNVWPNELLYLNEYLLTPERSYDNSTSLWADFCKHAEKCLHIMEGKIDDKINHFIQVSWYLALLSSLTNSLWPRCLLSINI